MFLNSLKVIAEWYLIIYYFLNHLALDGHWSYFQFVAIMNIVVMDIFVQICLDAYIFISTGQIYLR